MKINLLNDYMNDNNIKDYFFICDEQFGDFLYMNGRTYKVYISLSADISDDICNSVVINRKRYYFNMESVSIDKIHFMEGWHMKKISALTEAILY